MISYHITEGSHIDTVVAFNPDSDNPIVTTDSNNPHWEAILDGLRTGDTDVFDLFNVGVGVGKRLRALSDRVSYNGANILFDGDVVTGALADHVMRSLDQGVDFYGPVVKFWEKLASNPSKHSREQLFGWLQTHAFAINSEGDIVGYKGVNLRTSIVDGANSYWSTQSGVAFIDGVRHEGYIQNIPGTVVTMPRSEVLEDPHSPCHVGLHVADWSFASRFGGVATLMVTINPRDVVSVPHAASKMRVCRYSVIGPVDAPTEGAVIAEPAVAAWAGDVSYKVGV